MWKIVETLFPVFLFERLEEISIKALFKFRKIELYNLNFRNGKVYYKDTLYTGKTFLRGMHNFSDVFKGSKWTKDISVSDDKDEYDDISIEALEFDILQGEVKARYTYDYITKKVAKIIKFYYSFGEETETYYLNKNLIVIKKPFGNNPKGYKEEWDNVKRESRIFINGKLKKIEKHR